MNARSGTTNLQHIEWGVQCVGDSFLAELVVGASVGINSGDLFLCRLRLDQFYKLLRHLESVKELYRIRCDPWNK